MCPLPFLSHFLLPSGLPVAESALKVTSDFRLGRVSVGFSVFVSLGLSPAIFLFLPPHVLSEPSAGLLGSVPGFILESFLCSPGRRSPDDLSRNQALLRAQVQITPRPTSAAQISLLFLYLFQHPVPHSHS